MRGDLKTYQAKRQFDQTPEPRGSKAPSGAGKQLRYVIQRHAATRLHYDFRIEMDGVLKSWAVTKAPSRDPTVKRLAVEVEDHPIDYGSFEGTIPSGNYGAGTVQLWDTGSWRPQRPDTLEADFAHGSIKMCLDGERLKGGWALVRLKADRGKPSKRNNWLLIKEKDAHAVHGEGDALSEIDASVTTGRTLAEISDGDAQWTSSRSTRRKGPAKPKSTRAEATLASPADFTPIQLCKVTDHPPAARGWVHEIKFDGYRIQIASGGGKARLYTRRGHDWSTKFPELAADAALWPDGVIDGELCALDADNMPDFSALQTAIADGKTDDLVFFAFDLLSEGREDLRSLPLSHRKARLSAHIDRMLAKSRIRYVDHFASAGQAVLESACRMDLEGVISKRLDAPYSAGRSSTWLKSKCRGGDEVVIGGWSSEGGSRFRSLLVGVRDGDGLRYLGRVGTGYSQPLMKTLLPALKEASSEVSPFRGKGAPRAGREIHWLKPVLVAEVTHGGFTESGALRQAAFKGLREDKPATEVTERPQDPAPTGKVASDTTVHVPGERVPSAKASKGKLIVAGVAISNPDKVLWPGRADLPPITKKDLARYYEAVADRILVHIGNRPTSIIRAPDGVGRETFFQRHAMPGSNPRLHLIDVNERTPYLAVVDVGGLIAVGQSGGLELHPWGCAPGEPEVPDQVTFDLDPDEGLEFEAVIAAAKLMREKLLALGLSPFVKTTGGKGLHVVTPIKTDLRNRVTWDQNKLFAKALSEALRQEAPDRFTTTLAKKARGGKIFLDYLRNGRMATAVAPWSPRARPGAGIAYPLRWTQVRAGLDPTKFNLWSYPALLKQPDPWWDFRASAASLKRAMAAIGL
jgi:bifunctional non-homologous end joining protein LigD